MNHDRRHLLQSRSIARQPTPNILQVNQPAPDCSLIGRIMFGFCLSSALAADTFLLKENDFAQLLLQAICFFSGSLFVCFHLRELTTARSIQRLLAEWPVLLYVFLFTVSVTINWALGRNQTNVAILLGYVVGMLLFVIAIPIILLHEPRYLDFLCRFAIGCLAIVVLSCMIGSIGFDGILGIPLSNKSYYRFGPFQASGGIIEHPLTAGVMCSFISTFAFCYTNRRSLRFATALIAFLGLIVTDARGAIIAILICVGLLFLTSRRTLTFSRIIAISSLAAIGCVLVVAMLSNQVIRDFLRIDAGDSGRLGTWEMAWSYILDHPFAGNGPGVAQQVTGDLGYLQLFKPLGYAGFHNVFVDTAVNLGLPIAGLYLFVYLFPSVRAVKQRSVDAFFFSIPALIAAILSTFVTYNLGGARFITISLSIGVGLGYLLSSDVNSARRFAERRNSL